MMKKPKPFIITLYDVPENFREVLTERAVKEGKDVATFVKEKLMQLLSLCLHF
jgi:hypothetical protein